MQTADVKTMMICRACMGSGKIVRVLKSGKTSSHACYQCRGTGRGGQGYQTKG